MVAAGPPDDATLPGQTQDGLQGPPPGKEPAQPHQPPPESRPVGSRFNVLDGLEETPDFTQSVAKLKQKIQEIPGPSLRRGPQPKQGNRKQVGKALPARSRPPDSVAPLGRPDPSSSRGPPRKPTTSIHADRSTPPDPGPSWAQACSTSGSSIATTVLGAQSPTQSLAAMEVEVVPPPGTQ